MLKVLVKKQMAEIFRSYFYNAKKNKARSKGATAAYFILFILLMAGMLGGMFTILSQTLCEPLHGVGMDWLYFAMMGLTAVLLGTFGSVFNTFSVLYLELRAERTDGELSLVMEVKDLSLRWSQGEGETGKGQKVASEEEPWKTALAKDLIEKYGVIPEYYEDLGDGIYQVYVKVGSEVVPFVTVDSATGDYHG